MTLHCPRCNWLYEASDEYCRHCGRALISKQLPVVFSRTPLPARRAHDSGVPALSSQRALAVGSSAAVGVGLLTVLVRRFLIPAMTRRISRGLTPRSAAKPAPRTASSNPSQAQPAVVEQIIWIRRIIIRH